MNIPNTLTLFRIAMIPVLVIIFYAPIKGNYLWCAIIFSVAGITDWLDGYMARKLGQTTPLGAFLDPVADKLIVAVALALLIERYDSYYFTIPAVIIIGREIVISALREWMAELGKRTSVAVSYIGKVKTGFQITSIIVAFVAVPAYPQSPFYMLTMLTLYLAAALTLWSMIIYLKAAWPDLKS